MTQADLAIKLGVNRSLIGAYEEGRTEPKLKTIQALCAYFKVSIQDLIQKDLSGGEFDYQADVSGNKLRVLPIAVDQEGGEKISLIPQKAAAGYTHGYGDMEFIERMKTAQLPFPELTHERTHRIFQIEGDSMLPVPSGSYIVTEYVENWEDIRNDECYVILTESDGVVYKRVKNYIREKEEILLISDNKEYEPYTIPIVHVLEVWKARGVLNFDIPDNDSFNLQFNHKVMEVIDELRMEVKRLGDKIDS
jgi:DNA-binding XRE family transcriptional regulator